MSGPERGKSSIQQTVLGLKLEKTPGAGKVHEKANACDGGKADGKSGCKRKKCGIFLPFRWCPKEVFSDFCVWKMPEDIVMIQVCFGP